MPFKSAGNVWKLEVDVKHRQQSPKRIQQLSWDLSRPAPILDIPLTTHLFCSSPASSSTFTCISIYFSIFDLSLFPYDCTRHATVAVGPPYQMREKLDAASPAWTAVRLLDASIEKAELWMHRIGWVLERVLGKFRGASGCVSVGVKNTQKNKHGEENCHFFIDRRYIDSFMAGIFPSSCWFWCGMCMFPSMSCWFWSGMCITSGPPESWDRFTGMLQKIGGETQTHMLGPKVFPFDRILRDRESVTFTEIDEFWRIFLQPWRTRCANCKWTP